MTYVLTSRPLTILAELFISELGLDNIQVKVRGDEQTKPNESKLFIVLADLFGENMGHDTKDIPTSTGIERHVIIHLKNQIQVDVYSKTQEAIERKEELLASLQSYKADELMNKSGMSFQLHTTGQNTSYTDGANLMNKITFTLDVLWTKTITKSIPYYDDFGVYNLTN